MYEGDGGVDAGMGGSAILSSEGLVGDGRVVGKRCRWGDDSRHDETMKTDDGVTKEIKEE